MDILRIEEFRITPKQEKAIVQLLAECFPGYPEHRTYYKQLPNFRYLAFQEKQLVGHLAVEHRVISIDQKPFSIFGVVDICVAAQFRGQELASDLLRQLEKLGRENNIDFMLLTATDHPFYLNNGYQRHHQYCRWLFISDHQTLGVKNQHLQSTLLVKALGTTTWPEGTLDFLGEIF